VSDMQKQIEQMGFDAALAQSLAEIVAITRRTTIEECAMIAESHTTNLDGDEAAFVYRTARKIAQRIRAAAVSSQKDPS
jgi:hypothetical protein